MKQLNNERGAALILVLFGITLAMLFIMFQMEQLISTKTQVSSAERNIDSENIANMAVDRYKKEISKKLGEGKTLESIESSLKKMKKDSIFEKLDENHSYTIQNQEYDSNEKTLVFDVVGVAYKKETTRKGEIIITQE